MDIDHHQGPRFIIKRSVSLFVVGEIGAKSGQFASFGALRGVSGNLGRTALIAP